MRRLARFVGLTGSQRRTVLQALVTLPLVALGLRWIGLRRTHALLAGASRRPRGNANDIARLVAAAARHGPYRASCLPIALTLQWLLRRHGMDSDLRLGVRRAAGRLEAHAWVERGGTPLTEALGESGFTPFDGVIAPPAKVTP